MINFISNKLKFENVGRIFYLDQLRVLAIIGVIIIHVSQSFLGVLDISNFNWIVSDAFFNIARFAVPIFLALSGVLLLNREYKIKEFFKKRLARIISPFIFWGIIYVLFAFFIQKKFFDFNSVIAGVAFVGKMFLGVGGYLGHFWFVWLILSVYLFMPVINKWIKNSSLKEVEYFLVIWIVTCIFATFKLPYFSLDLSYFAGPIGYVILGYYLANKDNKILDNPLLWTAMFIISTVAMAILTYNNSLKIDDFAILGRYNLVLVLQTASIFLMFKGFNKKKFFSNKVFNFLKNGLVGALTFSLSKYSYGIFLVHILFLRLFLMSGIKFTHRTAIIWVPLIFIGILILSWGLLAILNRIPHLDKITGTH
ncbi:acyltransferase [Methanobrevibacter filiformis]|uniref:Acyltransferase family protein n=1 Tax=Methanobrevibacter filiformis TaxID=55758 RepID=A0A165ZQZ4_9EURY|nr:acyltransferase family protein [Methanobrevibacter filiformis]KZX11052.1 acyltransferase family protein [Methanobrevibacter filiformis]